MEFKTIIIPLIFMVVGASITFAFARLGKSRDNKRMEMDQERVVRDKANDERDEKIKQLEMQVAISAETSRPLAAAYAAFLISKLTHLHFPELDELMTRALPPTTLSQNEHIRMAILLAERKFDMAEEIDDGERLAADILPSALLLAKLEYDAAAASPVELLLVTQPVTEQNNGREEKKFDGDSTNPDEAEPAEQP